MTDLQITVSMQYKICNTTFSDLNYCNSPIPFWVLEVVLIFWVLKGKTLLGIEGYSWYSEYCRAIPFWLLEGILDMLGIGGYSWYSGYCKAIPFWVLKGILDILGIAGPYPSGYWRVFLIFCALQGNTLLGIEGYSWYSGYCRAIHFWVLKGIIQYSSRVTD